MSAKEREQKVLHRLIYKVDGKVCFAEWYAKGESLKSVAVPSKGTLDRKSTRLNSSH